jgi:hypothetical protein
MSSRESSDDERYAEARAAEALAPRDGPHTTVERDGWVQRVPLCQFCMERPADGKLDGRRICTVCLGLVQGFERLSK